ncbi:hypothetical protein M3Y98_00828200 [Aphelenchoides besseyi]|nr:hypothetical protein M3Y98_00828200 [Aphelenchoides besseyi]KAI6195392.1 hypothetical protein M3Y96_01226500 [Aphelenchoides besseyi]
MTQFCPSTFASTFGGQWANPTIFNSNSSEQMTHSGKGIKTLTSFWIDYEATRAKALRRVESDEILKTGPLIDGGLITKQNHAINLHDGFPNWKFKMTSNNGFECFVSWLQTNTSYLKNIDDPIVTTESALVEIATSTLYPTLKSEYDRVRDFGSKLVLRISNGIIYCYDIRSELEEAAKKSDLMKRFDSYARIKFQQYATKSTEVEALKLPKSSRPVQIKLYDMRAFHTRDKSNSDSTCNIVFMSPVDGIDTRGRRFKLKFRTERMQLGPYETLKASKWRMQSMLASNKYLIVGTAPAHVQPEKIDEIIPLEESHRAHIHDIRVIPVDFLNFMYPDFDVAQGIKNIHDFFTQVKKELTKAKEEVFIEAFRERGEGAYSFVSRRQESLS